MTTTHPVRPGLNLLDGHWYADDPHEVWSWMRREAPVYYDEAARRLGHHALRRRARRREGPGDVQQPPRASAARPAPADDDLHGRPRAPPAALAGQPGLHAPPHRRDGGDGRGALPPHRRPRLRGGDVRLRVGRGRPAPAHDDRRAARVRARGPRRPAAVVRRPASAPPRSTRRPSRRRPGPGDARLPRSCSSASSPTAGPTRATTSSPSCARPRSTATASTTSPS